MSQKAKHESRRRLLKQMAAGGGIALGAKELPERWLRPVVDSILLPAHAQTTVQEPSCGDDDRLVFDLSEIFGGTTTTTTVCDNATPLPSLVIENTLPCTTRLIVTSELSVDDDIAIDGQIFEEGQRNTQAICLPALVNGAHSIPVGTVLKSGISPGETTVVDLIDHFAPNAGLFGEIALVPA